MSAEARKEELTIFNKITTLINWHFAQILVNLQRFPEGTLRLLRIYYIYRSRIRPEAGSITRAAMREQRLFIHWSAHAGSKQRHHPTSRPAAMQPPNRQDCFMIDKQKLSDFVNEALADTDCFLTDLTVSADNDIVVEIDSDGSIDIDFCSALSRRIEEAFPRDEEDYTLEVGSAGITAPFKVRRQWEKNIGNDIEVYTRDGKKLLGCLTRLTDDAAVIETEQKVRREGMKRPVLERLEMEIPFADIRRANYDLQF